ncbi:MAG: hypothetical protein M1820_010396 [Bogoriella megaspora]|nr:MAG: hypothetical protein M1820_010396 [Bogoriella megaspora]
MYSSIALFSLVPLVSSLALPQTGAPSAPQQFRLQNIASHFMGDNSGIANGAWPPGTGFNTTISFTFAQDFANTTVSTAPTAVGCSAQWVPKGTGAQAYPTDWVECVNDGGFYWKFQKSADMDKGYAGAFLMDIRFDGIVNGVNHQFLATANVTANDYTPGANSLQCLGGAPLTGIHCTQPNGPFTIPVSGA